MKKYLKNKISIFLIPILMLALTGCIKNLTIGEPLVATIDAAATNTSLNPTFPVQLTINSSMPPNGIKVVTTVVNESTNTAITPQAPTYTTNNSSTTIKLINLPQQNWCVATIRITEINNVTNTITKSFRVIYK